MGGAINTALKSDKQQKNNSKANMMNECWKCVVIKGNISYDGSVSPDLPFEHNGMFKERKYWNIHISNIEQY